MVFRNIHHYRRNARSAEAFEGLKNTALEKSCLPAALLSNENPPIRSRSVDEDKLSLKQTEL